MNSEPLVSVLIPCYNVANYVTESVTSIIKQTYSNLEIILINDCSTDSTIEKLEDLGRIDSRIKIYNNESNFKLIKTLNKGIELCNGEYIARMDADDISLPERIQRQVEFLNSNVDYDIVSTMFYTFHSGKKKKYLYLNPTKYEDLKAYLLFKSGICHPAVMIRKILFTEKKLRFEQEYLHVEDYALWSKAMYCSRLANIDEALLLYRVHANQISSINERKQLENKKEVFKIHCDKLGFCKDSAFLDIYASVAECVPKEASYEYLKKCEDFILKIINKNEIEPFCSHEFLKKMLSIHWLRLCANSRLGLGVLKFCFNSKLYSRKEYKNSDMFILYFKCLFKIEYKKSFVYKIIFR